MNIILLILTLLGPLLSQLITWLLSLVAGKTTASNAVLAKVGIELGKMQKILSLAGQANIEAVPYVAEKKGKKQ